MKRSLHHCCIGGRDKFTNTKTALEAKKFGAGNCAGTTKNCAGSNKTALEAKTIAQETTKTALEAAPQNPKVLLTHKM